MGSVPSLPLGHRVLEVAVVDGLTGGGEVGSPRSLAERDAVGVVPVRGVAGGGVVAHALLQPHHVLTVTSTDRQAVGVVTVLDGGVEAVDGEDPHQAVAPFCRAAATSASSSSMRMGW